MGGTSTAEAELVFDPRAAKSTGTTMVETVKISGLTYTHTSAETGNVAKISFSDTSSNSTGNAVTNGLDIASVVNTTDSGTKEVNGLNIETPTLTCATGICTWSGIKISGATADATEVEYGIQIGSITGGGGSANEIALSIGTGWDRGLVIGDSSNYVKLAEGTTTGFQYGGTYRPLITWVLSPEYPGATLFADGSSNSGSMTSDYTNSKDTGSRATYYEWNATAGSLQDYDIVIRFTLPSNFATDGWEAGTDQAMVIDLVTETNDVLDNQIDATVRLESLDTADATEDNMVSAVAATWTTKAIDDSELTDCNVAGETCLIELKMQSKSGNYARVGDITLKYRAAF